MPSRQSLRDWIVSDHCLLLGAGGRGAAFQILQLYLCSFSFANKLRELQRLRKKDPRGGRGTVFSAPLPLGARRGRPSGCG